MIKTVFKGPWIYIAAAVIVALLCFACEPFAETGKQLALYFVALCYVFLILIVPINILSYHAVREDNIPLAVILSLFFGGIGGFSAAYGSNKNYGVKILMKTAFALNLLYAEWLIISSILMFSSYYRAEW